jgi:ubiquinone/menaquinone biosynthesis C-methylase UbiE
MGACLCLGLAGRSAAQAVPEELRFLPEETVLVAAFETSGATFELLPRFRDELLFALKLAAPLDRLEALQGASPPLERIVAAAIQWGGKSRGVLGIARGDFDDGWLEALVGSRRVRAHAFGERTLFLAPGDSEEAAELALAKLGARTLAFGGVLPVLEAVRLFDERGGEAPAPGARLSSLLSEVEPGKAVWAVARPEWLGFDLGEESLAAADVRGRSLSRSLVNVRSLSISAEPGSEIALTVRTRARDDEDARILADALGAFVRTSAAGAPEELRAVLGRAEIDRRGSEIRLTISLTKDSLGRLRRSRASRSLLTWRLGEEEREQRQRIGAVLEALRLSEGSAVADIGAGGGFFTVRLARAVGPAGRVYAVEIGEELVAGIQGRAEDASLQNVEAVLGVEDDPRLPEGSLDAALIVNSYHEMSQHEKMLRNTRAALRPGGRLVVIEPFRRDRRGEPRSDQTGRHEIAPELVEEELRDAGFHILERVDDFISHSDAGSFDALVVASRPEGK